MSCSDLGLKVLISWLVQIASLFLFFITLTGVEIMSLNDLFKAYVGELGRCISDNPCSSYTVIRQDDLSLII